MQQNAESRYLAESKIFIIEATSEEGERSSIKGTSSRKRAMEENNGILKEMTVSESFSKKVDDTEKCDKSVRDRKEDTVTKITIADQLNETQSILEEFSFDGSKREIKNPGNIGDMTAAGRHRCQRPLHDIIDKREQRREELEKMEGDLRQRLDMLECSMPAVMVWNIWRMSQGAPVCRIKRILEKQFKDTRELSCRSTPSCHYDCRVREVEAERKLALKRVEEARTLWSEKLATLEERKRKLDEARKIQDEQRNAIERLNEESRVLREAMEKKAMEMDESCQCGDTQCKQRHLGKVSSVTSVESGDIQCLEKLQRLAEEEVIKKREIAELERREEAYMRTLQQADELWSKMEGDMVSTTNGLQEQLDMKTAANQQLANRVCELEDALEKCRTRLAACRAELEKFLSIKKVEATIGRDDDVAKVVDKEVAVRAKVVHRQIGRPDDVATVKDDEVLAKIEVADEEILAKTEVADAEALARIVVTDVDAEAAFVGDDKFVSVRPDLVDLAVDRPVDLVRVEDAESVVRPEDLAYEQQRFNEVREYLAKFGSLEELYKDDGEPCPPDFVCNDVVTSPIGMTDEELIALGLQPPAPTEERDKTVSDEEREKLFQKELARKANGVVDDIEKKEKENEIPGIKIESKVVEKMETRFDKIEHVPVKETITPRTIEEEAADDKLITIPKNRGPKVNKIEADRGIVIQRDTILSWIDAIDTIRTTAARHPDCREVKKDADILVEQVGTYIGVKPKAVEEENDITITEGKREKVIEKNKIKTLQDELIILKDKEMEPVTKTEFVPFPNSEETPAEVKAPVEAIAESELLPILTKEEVPIGMEPPTAVSIEDSFQPPTIHNEKDLKDDTVPITAPEPYKPDIEKIKTKETRVEEITENAKKIEISKNKYTEKNATVEDRINDKLAVYVVANDKMVNSTDKEEMIVQKIEKEEQEVISNHVEINEKKEKDIPIETKIEKREIVENEKVDKVLPVTETEESKFIEEVVEESKEISQLDETKMPHIKETIPHMEIIRTNEIAEVSPVPEMKKIEQEAEKTILTVDVKEVKEIVPEIILPTVDTIEVKKVEPNKFPIVDIEKVSITNAVEEKIKIDEPTPILDIKEVKEIVPEIISPTIDTIKVEKVEPDKFPTMDIEKVSIANAVEEKIKIKDEPTPILDVKEELFLDEKMEEKIEIEKPVLIKEETETIKSPPIADTAEIEKIEIAELSPIDDIKKEIIEAVTLPPISDIVKEEKIEAAELPSIAEIVEKEKIEAAEMPPMVDIIKKEIEIEAKELLPLADVVTEEKIEIIQPTTIPTIKRKIEEEIEAAKESVLKREIKKEKDEEIDEKVALPEQVTPSIELLEKKKEEEIPPVKKEEILTEVSPLKKPTVKDKKEVEEKKPEVVQIELKIPVAEIKSTEIEIPLEPRLVAQPYLIIAKIKEKELLQIIPARSLCTEYCLRPSIETAKPFEIPQTNVVQTKIVQTEVIQAEVVQTEVMQTKIVENEIVQTEVVQTEAVETEVVQITTQTVSTAEPPGMPIRFISEYLKPAELKASRTEIAGDRPEITGRKMLWRKRLKDQSTVTTASTGSQTDKTSHVSHDRVVRDERERARVPTDKLLRSIKIAAAGLARPDTEREIRTINYGGKSEETGRVVCNCCLCGRIPTPPSTGFRLEVPPQIDAKTAMPPAVTAFKRMFIRPKIDHPIPHDRLCPDCKVKIQSRMPRERYHVEKIIKKISQNQESCGCASLTGKACRTAPRKKAIEKKDQACLAKIPRRKTNPVEQKRKDDLQSILEDSEKLTVEPLSPSCICFKLEKTEPIKKGNCYCTD